MNSPALWTDDRWTIVLPERSLTAAHLAIIDGHPEQPVDVGAAASLLHCYERIRSALAATTGAEGFAVSFAVNWRPGEDQIGEPEPIGTHSRVIHVFGRRPGEPTTPTRVMAVPATMRRHVGTLEARTVALTRALSASRPVQVVGPREDPCDGCSGEVLSRQERWRAGGVRVIRPRRMIIDPYVLVLPLRHVVSLGDLYPEEVVSVADRLREVLRQFRDASGSTGLSCFANDGTAARQETPHVHLHVFGRSPIERVNPFEELSTAHRQREHDE